MEPSVHNKESQANKDTEENEKMKKKKNSQLPLFLSDLNFSADFISFTMINFPQVANRNICIYSLFVFLLVTRTEVPY